MEKQLTKVKNKQLLISWIFWVSSIFFIFVMITPFIESNPLSGIWALAFLGFFLSISCAVIALIFRNRAKKMDKLLSGEKLLVHLELDKEMLQQYAETLRNESRAKNKAVMWVVGILFAVITIPFLFFLEKDEISGFLAIIGSVVLLIFVASRFFPVYYYRKNMKGDRQILIGEKYAYFNGFFHNWDYPLSGLTTAKTIKKPFRGIHLAYYYTDLTWKHIHEIKIPIPDDFDFNPVIQRLKQANKKG